MNVGNVAEKDMEEWLVPSEMPPLPRLRHFSLFALLAEIFT